MTNIERGKESRRKNSFNLVYIAIGAVALSSGLFGYALGSGEDEQNRPPERLTPISELTLDELGRDDLLNLLEVQAAVGLAEDGDILPALDKIEGHFRDYLIWNNDGEHIKKQNALDAVEEVIAEKAVEIAEKGETATAVELAGRIDDEGYVTEESVLRDIVEIQGSN